MCNLIRLVFRTATENGVQIVTERATPLNFRPSFFYILKSKTVRIDQ